ncbi:MAG: DUF2934 domain-containing protein [Chloroflexi bacterium]|nr:DUF2934 domain-containing protein [Chloroflexota bacterium]
MVTEQQIKELAYAIWEEEGCPNGKDQDHYFRAMHILGGSTSILPHRIDTITNIPITTATINTPLGITSCRGPSSTK